jgi:hypothetical protein
MSLCHRIGLVKRKNVGKNPKESKRVQMATKNNMGRKSSIYRGVKK